MAELTHVMGILDAALEDRENEWTYDKWGSGNINISTSEEDSAVDILFS